ncbi:hypothetical protein EPUL_001123, partial [Erysiphe pulchra]
MQLTVLPFLSTLVLNSVSASLDSDSQSGFDCGRVFFGRNVIKSAGSFVSRNLRRSSQISLVDGVSFQGGNPDHVGWPIRESGQIYTSSRSRESFYVLVDSWGKVKGVMARLANDDYTRCLRKSSRRKSLLLSLSNGYRCGQNFFGDEQLRGDVDEAISKLGQGLKYPSPYKGNLYTGYEYLTWPIMNEKKDNTSHWEQSPFHVILSRDGKIIDVVAKLKCNDFIKCERATKSLQGRSLKTSLLQRRNAAAPSDYLCDQVVPFRYANLVFFRDLSMAKDPIPPKKNSPTPQGLPPAPPRPKKYPKKYNQPPCQAALCQLWPIFPNGLNYAEGMRAGKHFLMMDMEFNIKG